MTAEKKREYEISGRKFSQSELTLGQDLKLAEILSEIDIKDFANMTVIELVKILSKNNLIIRFLSVILKKEFIEDFNPDEFLNLTNTELSGIFADFFDFNPILRSAFAGLKTTADITKE